MSLSASAPSSPTITSIARHLPYQGSPLHPRNNDLNQSNVLDGDGDDNISAPTFPIYPQIPNNDYGDCDRHYVDGQDYNRDKDKISRRRDKMELDEQTADEDETTVALNAADRSFLDTLQEEEEVNISGDERNGDEEDDDGNALRYDRRMWPQFPDLDNDDHQHRDVDDVQTAFGTGGERGLMIGPLLPPPENAVNSVATDAMLTLGPSLLGAPSPSRDDQATLHDLDHLTALTHDTEHLPPSSDDYITDGGKGHEQHSRRGSPNGTETIFPSIKAREMYLGGRTPPRKRKFDLILNSDGDVDNILLDNFKPPSHGVQRGNQNDEINLPTTSRGQILHPRQPNPPYNNESKFDMTDHHALGLLRSRDPDPTLGHSPTVTSTLDPKRPQPCLLERIVPEPIHQHGSRLSQPQSMARKRWNFVISEQAKVQRTFDQARGDWERAQKILKEAQEQLQSVNDAVRKTCEDCYSFLIQEDKDWYEGYQLLREYHDKFGHTRVPRNNQNIKRAAKTYATRSDRSISSCTNLSKLSRWVGTQRQLFKKGELDGFKIHALKRIDFDFDPVTTRWNAQYQSLKKFVEDHGHARVPYSFGAKPEVKTNSTAMDDSDDSPLGAWVKRQQHQYKRFQNGSQSELTLERIRLLNDVGMVWNRREASWMERMKELQEFKSANGHLNVQSADNAILREWLRDQRAKYHEYKKNPLQSSLSLKQVALIQEVGIENCDPNERKWRERIKELLEFQSKHGHCFVPQHSRKYENLANWSKRQRQQYRYHIRGQSSLLTVDRIDQLRRIGFEFEPTVDQTKQFETLEKTWDDFYSEIEQFQKNTGHVNVPESTNLGRWWKDQQTKLQHHREGVSVDLTTPQADKIYSLISYSNLPAFKRQRGWEEWLGDLLAHRIHAKTFRLPHTEEFFGLRNWVEEQRNEYSKYTKGEPSKMTQDRVWKLQRLKFPFNLKGRSGKGDKTHQGKSWEESYIDLLQFYLLRNSFEVPEHHRDLHNWVKKQRELYRQHSSKGSNIPFASHILDRLNKLERVGFPFKQHNDAYPESSEHDTQAIQSQKQGSTELIFQPGSASRLLEVYDELADRPDGAPPAEDLLDHNFTIAPPLAEEQDSKHSA
jgi:hypothetical protein